MAAQPRRGGISLPERSSASKPHSNILARITSSPIVSRGKQAASDAAFVSKKLLRSTGKAAWIAGTTFLILFVPLIIEMDREQQFNELELQQASLLDQKAWHLISEARMRIEKNVVWINLRIRTQIRYSPEDKSNILLFNKLNPTAKDEALQQCFVLLDFL
ncbi:hypothetical protein Goshw_028185 [Gossypium schwendimanii]|uniref:Uncharacterized protein n=1 Tax=Gossypium schwendimanii TaxID=34291 RepID=A0A7J9KNW0_GOSSC|nr:hypothetical protein [Gossypium schwendimanii]